MLTQLDLMGGTGGGGSGYVMDEDSGTSGSRSPMDGLVEYPMEQAEFKYFDAGFGGDAFYEGATMEHQALQQSLANPPDLINPDPAVCDPQAHSTDGNLLTYDDQGHISSFSTEYLKFTEGIRAYDSGGIAQDGDQIHIKFEDGIKLEDDQIQMKFEDSIKLEDEIKFEDEMKNYETFSDEFYDSSLGDQTGSSDSDNIGFSNLYETLDPEQSISSPEEPMTNLWSDVSLSSATKVKIGPLQRRALDSIFRVTEKPSRGLVLHIASELGLHHFTVKNFFCNGRRRLRRAAARLRDPEKTKRENERRKEKRRLAAQTSPTNNNNNGGSECKGGIRSNGSSKTSSPQSLPSESPPPKEPPVLSPERKALMEKLADKVQRSKAQRCLAADLEQAASNAFQPIPTATSHTHHTTQPQTNLRQPQVGQIMPQTDLTQPQLATIQSQTELSQSHSGPIKTQTVLSEFQQVTSQHHTELLQSHSAHFQSQTNLTEPQPDISQFQQVTIPHQEELSQPHLVPIQTQSGLSQPLPAPIQTQACLSQPQQVTIHHQTDLTQPQLAPTIQLPTSSSLLLPQHTHDVTPQPDILSQASQELLSQVSHDDLLTQSSPHHDFLTSAPAAPPPPPSSLLQPSSDPWDLL